MAIAWSPPDRYLTRSRLRRFAAAHGHEDFGSLHRWSVEDQDGFWRAVDRDLGLVWRTPYRHVFDVSRGLPWTTWWLGGRMNYVESALRHDAARTPIIFEGAALRSASATASSPRASAAAPPVCARSA